MAEKVVCRNSGLSRVDRNLDLTYRRLRDEVGFFESLKVRNQERAFIRDRNACGDDYTCVRVTYRGQMLEIEIGLDKVEYALREGEGLVFHHEAEEVQLTRDNPLAVRPVSRW